MKSTEFMYKIYVQNVSTEQVQNLCTEYIYTEFVYRIIMHRMFVHNIIICIECMTLYRISVPNLYSDLMNRMDTQYTIDV